MILLDSNVLMYAAGAPHANKASSVQLLEDIAAGRVDAAVDAEVLQEILHRYRAIGRWKDGCRVFELTRQIITHVIPVTASMMDSAKTLLNEYDDLMARDALHAAACLETQAYGLCSFDRDFDQIAGLHRFEPDGAPRLRRG